VSATDTDEAFEWDEEVVLRVTMRVRAKPNPDFFEGLLGRTPEDAAYTAAWRGGMDLERTDGWADMLGEVDVVEVEAW
jgi:hypothetical protein